MSTEFLKRHAQTLSEFAAATQARASQHPDDRWLAIAADNQRRAASDAMQALAVAHAQEAAVAEPETYEEIISGCVAGITDTGKLELRTSEGKVHIRFPLDLTEKVQHLSIAKLAELRVSTTRYWDAVAKKDVFRRLLIDISAPL
ncbi:MAG: hypothetical protein V4578_12360 [Pseudomonadota bacterium]